MIAMRSRNANVDFIVVDSIVSENNIPRNLFKLVGSEDEPSPPSQPDWMNYPAVASYGRDDTFYSDIINHTKRRERFDNLITDAHETSHFIHSDIRNQHGNGITICGFYVGENRAITMPQPRFRKSAIAPLVPPSLRETRYSLYLLGMRSWDDSPLYIYDEWVSYANGGLTGVDLVERGKYRGQWQDGVMGTIEFTMYALGVVLAIEKNDEDYFDRSPQFLTFTKWHIHRCKDIYDRGKVMAQFRWGRQERLEESLRNSSDAAPFRELLKRRFDSVWL